MKTRLASSLLAFSATGLLTVAASADPALRVQVSQKGDFVLLGNTMGYECNTNPAVPAPIVGTANCTGSSQQGDSAPDIFWRSGDDNSAAANDGISVAQARSTAVLQLPSGASVTHAFLYWAAYTDDNDAPDPSVTLDRPGAGSFTATVTTTGTDDQPPIIDRGANAWYQSVADITTLVQNNGPGAYRVSGIDSIDLVDEDDNDPMVGWAMVVLYELDTEPPRNLAIFDGLDLVSNSGTGIEVDIEGFLVPSTGFDAKLGVITYEGEQTYTGDALLFNGNTISNGVNPANNFFNSTRSYLGARGAQHG